MTDDKQGLAGRFARWAGIGNNGGEMTETETGAMDEQGVATATAEAMDGGAGQVDLEAGTEGASNEVNEIQQLSAELEQARGERDLIKDRLARLQAEFDNARKREAKERQDARDRGVEAAVEPFLGVMDNFALALKAEGSVEQLRAGVDLILKQMEEALRGLSVQPVETVGAQFDPRVHEALGSVETAEYPDHQVIDEIRRGYKLREKLLRPALVRIATNSAQREA
ncbi:MAG TPA: nucleotide exchange factor GrpE [Acidobacteriaceae bacterium]|nr:nucleotide exchange factor GrpE [Acidobacteriaceae bacterium]